MLRWFVTILLFAASAAAHAETRGVRTLVPAPALGKPFSASHALVIGVDGYDHGWKPLGMAAEDARQVAAALKESGFDDVELKLDLGEAELERTIKAFIYGKGADPDARLLIWFAGHGHTIGGEGYLVPKDAPLPGETPASEAAFQASAMPLAAFGRYMNEVKARHVIAVFDSCFSGSVFNASRASVPAAVSKATTQLARQFIASGSAGEVALDDGSFRQAFIAALTGKDRRALNSDGYLTGSRLGAYLAEEISRKTGGRQNPIYSTSNVVGLDRGDFVFPVSFASQEGPAEVAAPVGLSPLEPAVAEDVPELRIEPVQVARDNPEAGLIADKLARNLVEYYVNNRLYVSSELTGREPARPPTHRLHTKVTAFGDSVQVDIDLTGRDGKTVSTASFGGERAFYVHNYKFLPQIVQYMLDVSLRTLEPLHSANRPTEVGEAYAFFLAARQKASRRQFEDAAALLDKAIEADPDFASAYAARGQIAARMGAGADEVDGYLKEAAAIDADYPSLNLFDEQQMGDPVPALRAAGANAPWSVLSPGLEFRRIEAEDYGVTVLAWRFDEASVAFDVARASTVHGETVEELRERTGALLAINASFFDLDMESRLSPVGMLVVGGREINAFDAAKAKNPLTGILYRRDGKLGIMPASQYRPDDRFEAAVQTGPLVVDPGGRNGIYRNNFDRQNRSAVCIQGDGRPVIVQVSGGLSLYEVGEMLSSPDAGGGLGCERAINLDGGPSSQISVLAGGIGLEVTGLWKVPNSLLLTAR
jgi:uncharacterized protein YigE (DUF2233 family)